MNALHDDLAAALGRSDAAHLLTVGEPGDGWQAWLDGLPPMERTALNWEESLPGGLKRATLALLFATSDALNQPSTEHLLARLRDTLADRVIMSVNGDVPQERVDALRALGFSATSAPGGGLVFGFDIESYNEPREWNTPENWANPENFDRYRW